MLQQTQVTTVIPFFSAFITRFPTLHALANASLDEVMNAWAGLGFYSRARNLHACAKQISEQYQGKFPSNLDALKQLPGIGRSTAGAILAFGFGLRAPILDSNVKRIFARLYAVKGEVNSKTTEQRLWNLAETHTPFEYIQDYTQAIMDLGALICTAKKPACFHCPLAKQCLAHQQGKETEYPEKKRKKTLPIRSVNWLIMKKENRILFEKRPTIGIWGNLWSFPEYSSSEEKPALFIRQHYGVCLIHQKSLPLFRHTFSHFHLDITPIIISVKFLKNSSPLPTSSFFWLTKREWTQKGLPQPVKKLLDLHFSQ